MDFSLRPADRWPRLDALIHFFARIGMSGSTRIFFWLRFIKRIVPEWIDKEILRRDVFTESAWLAFLTVFIF